MDGFDPARLDRLRAVMEAHADAGAPVRPRGSWREVTAPPSSTPPAFASAAGGRVSTIDDVHAFGQMLLTSGGGVLSPASIALMTTNHLLPGQGGPAPDGAQGWGFGVDVQLRHTALGQRPGSYGWAGGLGTSWANDPSTGLGGVVLTNEAFTGAFPPPPVVRDFWTLADAALR